MTPQWTSSRDSLHLEIARLRRQLEERDAKIEQLTGMLINTDVDAWQTWGLTHNEARLLGALMCGRVCTKSHLMDLVYETAPGDQPDVKIVDVFVCKLRKKLAPHGVVVDTVWGRGFRMREEMIVRARALCTAPVRSAA